MKISQLFAEKKPVLSFEIFPPKPDSPFEPILHTIDELAGLKPDFISVTYGAAGSNRGRTMQIAEHIKKHSQIESLAHLTCIIDTEAEIAEILTDIKTRGIKNILALRGDPPQECPDKAKNVYAINLIRQIKELNGFCIGAAAYPEGHPECPNRKQEFIYLKEKIHAGVDFLVTQIFFDNNFFYSLQENLARNNLAIPLCAGIMPVFAKNQIERICSLCGSTIPSAIQNLMEKYGHNPDDMQKAGLEYAAEQILDLVKNQAAGIHLYTMNKPHLAKEMVQKASLR